MRKTIKIFIILNIILSGYSIVAHAEENVLEGTVSIISDGNPQYNETVSADISGVLNNTGILSYQWTRNGVEISGQTGIEYILTQADIGTQIGVNVTSSVETGILSGSIANVNKADQAAPAAPTLQNKDHYNITLNEAVGCEYKISSGSYSESRAFGDLKANTGYTFYQRYAETATHNASPSSSAFTVTTDYVNIANTAFDISTLNPGDGVLLSGSVTLEGAQSIRIKCSAGTTLTLNGVIINVSNMSGEAAIKFTGSGNKLILVGSNKIYSGSGNAGIENTGSLSISGGGTISIALSNGSLTAVSGTGAAGIGGGSGGNGGSVSISGGFIFASGSISDIGGGSGGSMGSLTISGTSAVFIENDKAPTASVSTHILLSNEAVSSGKAYGYSLPSLWSDGQQAYAYIKYCNVLFQTNGGGIISPQEIGAGLYALKPSDPSKQGVVFGGWYTDINYTDAFNFASERIKNNITLYAKWNAEVTIIKNGSGSINPTGKQTIASGEDLVITCVPEDGFHVEAITSSHGYNITDNEDNTYTIVNIAVSDIVEIVFKEDELQGIVTIDHDGLPEFGDKLTANTSGITNNPANAEFTYKWTRDGKEISNANLKEYRVVKDDIGHKITVKVFSTGKEGYVESSKTSTIQKAMKPAPREPLLKEKTMTSITLFPLEGCEYKMEGGLWQESNVFEDLQVDTEYTFYQRYAETETYKKSNTSFNLKVFTLSYSITDIDIEKEYINMSKGDTDNIDSLLNYLIRPEKIENDSVYWHSSNTNVAIIDSEKGIITALREGKTIITVTAADTTNGEISDSCILQVYSISEEDMGAFLGGLSGRLTDIQGNELAGYTITLYSNPIEIITDDDGKFNLDFIPYTSHVMVVEDGDNNEIGRFIINWNAGEKYRANIDNNNNVINITYTELTTSINLPIQVNKDFNDINVLTVEGISFAAEEETDTIISKKIYVLVLLGIIAACIIGVGYVLYIGRIQNREDYNEELNEEGIYQQTLLEQNTETRKGSLDEDE